MPITPVGTPAYPFRNTMTNTVIAPPTFFSPIHVPQNWQITPRLRNAFARENYPVGRNVGRSYTAALNMADPYTYMAAIDLPEVSAVEETPKAIRRYLMGKGKKLIVDGEF